MKESNPGAGDLATGTCGRLRDENMLSGAEDRKGFAGISGGCAAVHGSRATNGIFIRIYYIGRHAAFFGNKKKKEGVSPGNIETSGRS